MSRIAKAFTIFFAALALTACGTTEAEAPAWNTPEVSVPGDPTLPVRPQPEPVKPIPAQDMKIGDSFTMTYPDAIVEYRVVEADGIAEDRTDEERSTSFRAQITVVEGSHSTNGGELQFQDETGRVHDGHWAIADTEDRYYLETKTVLKGQTLDGWVAVDVPKTLPVKTGWVVLVDDAMIDPIARWKL